MYTFNKYIICTKNNLSHGSTLHVHQLTIISYLRKMINYIFIYLHILILAHKLFYELDNFL